MSYVYECMCVYIWQQIKLRAKQSILACYQKSLGLLFGSIVSTLFQSLELSCNTQGKITSCPPLKF